MGIKDANYLVPELYPSEVDDIINLPTFYRIAKMAVNGHITPPFPVRTMPDHRVANAALAEGVREASRQRYGRDALIVGHEIQQRFKRSPKDLAVNGT